MLASVAKTGRCVIVHEAARTGGFGAEIAALIAERGLTSLLAPVARVTGYDTVMPLPRLEQHYMPSVGRIVAAARKHLPVQLNFSGAGPMRQFMLPDLGEGLEEAEIVTWYVNEGDHVVADQPLVSVETDKAVVEVPSPSSGRIARLFGAKGDLVKVGAPLVEFAEGPEARHRHDRRRTRRERATRGGSHSSRTIDRTERSGVFLRFGRSRASSTSILNSSRPRDPAAPSHARDVERAAKSMSQTGPAEPLRGMRRAMAQRMTAAHAEIVPATVTDEADIDDWRQGEDVTIRLVRAIAAACKAEPALNAWYNAGAGERRLIERVDLGIAVDTGGGLIVPVLRNVAERTRIGFANRT